MFLAIVSIILARSALEGSDMAESEDAVEGAGEGGGEGRAAAEEDDRWPEDRRNPDTRLSRASNP
jgi:hypothetical protein